MVRYFFFISAFFVPLASFADGLGSIKVNNAPELKNVLSIKHGLSQWHRVMNSNRPTASSNKGGQQQGDFSLIKAVDVSSEKFYQAMSNKKKIRHMVVSLKSRPKQGYIQYTLENVQVKSVKPINPSKYRRAAYERISLSYEQIRWARRMPEKSSAVVAAN